MTYVMCIIDYIYHLLNESKKIFSFIITIGECTMGTCQVGLQGPRPSLRQTILFFLNRESLGFFRSIFNLKGRATCHSKSLLGLLGRLFK